MHWSTQPISFGLEDHPDIMPSLGGYGLILDPTLVSDKLACTFSASSSTGAAA